MIVIPCPHCGPRNHDEFAYAGDAGLTPPAPDAPLADWSAYIYIRDNPRSAHRELWRHSYGCGAYLVVERDTRTHAVISAAFAGEETGNAR
jgi:heterotetrameric sarcosine oxidase delta subunit